jgi:rhodanese-related sulfurtransferase
VQAWQRDGDRSLFLLDVRSRREFEEQHIAGSRHAAGGQVVQATDEYIGVRNARVVLIDPARVRSVMTAHWLNQMGWPEVYVLEPEGADGFSGWQTARGPRQPVEIARAGAISPAALAARLAQGGVSVIDLSTSLQFRAGHVPGAWWAVRARLDQARARLPDARSLVLSSPDAMLAHLAAPEAKALWPDAQILVLDGGNAAWSAAGLALESGSENLTTELDDVWYKPYDQPRDYAQHARAYLSWEVALVEQIKREPAVRFRTYD